jgi:hypothetical protein
MGLGGEETLNHVEMQFAIIQGNELWRLLAAAILRVNELTLRVCDIYR